MSLHIEQAAAEIAQLECEIVDLGSAAAHHLAHARKEFAHALEREEHGEFHFGVVRRDLELARAARSRE